MHAAGAPVGVSTQRVSAQGALCCLEMHIGSGSLDVDLKWSLHAEASHSVRDLTIACVHRSPSLMRLAHSLGQSWLLGRGYCLVNDLLLQCHKNEFIEACFTSQEFKNVQELACISFTRQGDALSSRNHTS